MAAHLSYSTTANSTGAVACSFGAPPVGGSNLAAALGTATSATVQVQVRVGAEWLLADTLQLPHPTTGVTALNCPIYPAYNAVRWNVTTIAGGSINLDAVGLGV